jgi:hypothetical protein
VQITPWNNTPRRSREPFSPFFSSAAVTLPRTSSDLTSRPSQRSVAAVSKGTPFAYATPHSVPLVSGPAFIGGDGDTEADEDLYHGDDDDDSDGEHSWPGVAAGDDDSEFEVDIDMGAEDELTSFSVDDSGLGSEDLSSGSDDDDGDSDSDDAAEVGFGAQRTDVEDAEDDEDDDPLDALLGILQD